MPKFDGVEEVVIDSPSMVVYKAVLNEFAGVTHWWMPLRECKLRGDIPIREGAICDITMHAKGVTSKASVKVTKIEEAKSIGLEFIGDFLGTEEWTFEPTDGKTKLQYRVNARTNRLLFSVVSPFVNFGKGHSDGMQYGFKALNSYLSKK
jgi:hypothetical protein